MSAVLNAQSEQELFPVTLQLKWNHQFQFAGYYAAIEQGYYREAGLDVTLVAARPGMDPAVEVLAGRAEFGVGTSELLLWRSRGDPVVVLATIFQHSPQVVLARKTSRTIDLQTLYDQPIMLEPQSAELLAYFKYEGMDPDKLKIVPHTFAVKDLIEGRVAAMSAYSTDEPFQMKAAGVDYLTFMPRAGGIDFYGDNLFTTEGMIARNPDKVRRFREASLRGWEYALTHSDEVIDLILRDYETPKTREALEFEATHTKALMHPGLIEVGHINVGRWRYMANTYAEFGMMPAEFDLAKFLYDPNPDPDYRWAYWTMGGLALLALGTAGWALPLWRLNRRLQAAKEQAEKADQAKSRYLAFMTHELRAPLSGMAGIVYELAESPLNADQQELVELLDHTAHTQLRLIDGILDYAKVEAGSLQLERVSLNMREFVDRAGGLFRSVGRIKEVELHCEVASDVPEVVLTDPMRLNQIVSNLLSNAVKFTTKGAVRFTVSRLTEGDSPPADTVTLQLMVSDTGMGISEEAQAKLFRLYEQGDSSVGREYGGTGLGLAISKRLVEIMRGSIAVRSIPGEGATFTVVLPVGKAGRES